MTGLRGRAVRQAGEHRDGRRDWWGVVVDSRDPHALATFWAAVLDARVVGAPGDDDVALDLGEGVAYVSFQREPDHVPPTWPAGPRSAGAQRMQLHLDVEVDDLEAATAHAVELGAVLADHQSQDDVRVLLDPDGHPFCLYRHDAGDTAREDSA